MKKASPTNSTRLTSFLRAALRTHFSRYAGAALPLTRCESLKRSGKLAGAAAACGLLLPLAESSATNYDWMPADTNWNDSNNWLPNSDFPKVAADTAFFSGAVVFNPTVNSTITIGGITFNAAADPYTITNLTGFDGIIIVGAGILNNSGNTQIINNDGGSTLEFDNGASAGTDVEINNSSTDAFIDFRDSSKAGSATISNAVAGTIIFFENSSTAENATLNNTAAGSIFFFDISKAGNSTINNSNVGGFVNFNDFTSAENAIINNTGAGGDPTTSSQIAFNLSSDAGTATIYNSAANTRTYFSDTSTAADAQIFNSGAGSTTQFFSKATAGSALATITNSGANSFTSFQDSSNAGSATITNSGTNNSIIFSNSASGGSAHLVNAGTTPFIDFLDSSTAGSATIDNTVANAIVFFENNSTAGSATINNTAAASVFFFNNSTAGGSTINNINPNAFVNFNDFTSAGNATINNLGPGADTTTSSQIAFNLSSSAGNATINNSATNTRTYFSDTSTAGAATINNSGAGSTTLFLVNSTAGDAVITNSGSGSFTEFNSPAPDSATAGNATITNSGPGSYTMFIGNSSGGTAALVNANPTAFIDISQLTSAGTTAGSIAGDGKLFLGSKNLAVGGNATDTTFSGIIQDGGLGGGAGGSLTKVGGGTLILTGANIYTGNTAINGGALIVNGSIASPSTFVNPGGRLGGIGVIGGNVLNRGVVEPGNTPSGLTVKGNYTQASDGNLRINIASNTTYGKLNVNGAASLSGSVTAVGVNGFKPKRGDSFRFLTAAGGVSGRFDALHSNFAATGTILQLGLTYEPNAVLLEFQQGSFADFAAGLDGFNGLTRNQKSVAKALDKVLFDKRERRLIDYLNGRSLSDLPGDFDRIAPEELGSIFETGISLANVQNTNIQRRNDDLRNGANGFSSAGMAMQGSGPGYSGPLKFRTGVAGPTGSEGKQSKTIYDPAPDNRWGVFLTGVGEWVDVGGNGNARGYDIRTGGFTFGVDYKVTPNFAFGVSAGYAGTGADLTNGGRVLINGGKLGLYATYFTGGFYMDAAATGGYNSYDTKRRSIQGTARGDTEGGEFNALIGGGYDIKAGNWSFGPTANVQYTYVGIDDYREHGSLAPLQIQRQNAESLRTAVGFRTSYNITLRNGLIIRPEVRAAWQHEFGDRNFEIASRFASGAGSTFNVNGPETGRDSLLLGAGVALQFNEYLSIYLYYDGQVARTDYESHNVSGGVRIAY